LAYLLKILILTPFHERGFKKLAKYVRKARIPIYLPLPVEVCRDRRVLSNLPPGLESLLGFGDLYLRS